MEIFTINPNIEDNLETVTKSKDFSDFLDYLVLRRDLENCDSDELEICVCYILSFKEKLNEKSKRKKKPVPNN
jgi:hypothetical protein